MPVTAQFATFASTAGRLRNRNAAAFASFKKYAAHFLNTDFIGTEPKEAANPVTGGEIERGITLKELNYTNEKTFNLKAIYLVSNQSYSTAKFPKVPIYKEFQRFLADIIYYESWRILFYHNQH